MKDHKRDLWEYTVTVAAQASAQEVPNTVHAYFCSRSIVSLSVLLSACFKSCDVHHRREKVEGLLATANEEYPSFIDSV
jgi:hypothetical protein